MNIKIKSIDSIFRNEIAWFISFIIVLVISTPHTAQLFMDMSRLPVADSTKWLHGYIYAIVIEFNVFMLVVNGKKTAGIWYAVGSLICNILYWHKWDEIASGGDYKTIVDLFTSLLLSAFISGSIWYFAELFEEKIKAKQEQEKAKQEQRKATELLTPYKCEQCEARFKTSQALNAHKSVHK